MSRDPLGLALRKSSWILLGLFLLHCTTQTATERTPSPLTIGTTAFNGVVNITYTGSLTATGGTPPYTWTQLSGELPPGLALSSFGTLSGTPTTEGSYAFTLEVEDSAGLTASGPYGMSVGGQLQVGCGAFTDNSTCGDVGDPYEGNGPPPNQQPVSGCNTTLSSNTNYKLTGNVGSDPTALCLLIDYNQHNVNLDLGGFTVTGTIEDRGAGNGDTIYNGTVTCNKDTHSYPQSCVDAYPQTPITSAQLRIHHLTVNQQNPAGQQVIIEQDTRANYAGGGSGLGTPCRIDHITWTSIPTSSGVNDRYGSLNVGGPPGGACNAEIDDNYIHCTGGNLNACEGMGGSPPQFLYIHNNEVLMDRVNTRIQNGRAIDCDAGAGVGGTCDVYNNYVVATNNRAVRYRICTAGLDCSGVQSGNVYGNQFLNIQQEGAGLAAIHLGGDDVNLESANIQVYGNTLELNTGSGIVAATITGVTAHDNIITCYSGSCTGADYVLYTDASAFAPTGGSATIQNTTLPSGWGSKAAVMACGPAGNPSYACINDPSAGNTSVTYCNTGKVVGNGQTKGCP